MIDWNEYRGQLNERLGLLGKLSPGTMQGVTALAQAGEKTAHLYAKTRKLISLTVAVTTRCDG